MVAGDHPQGDDDLELDDYLRRRSLTSVVRFAVMGLVLASASLAAYLYGRNLAEAQAHSSVKFALPTIIQVASLAGLFVGAVLLAIGAGLAFRTWRSRKQLPAARVHK